MIEIKHPSSEELKKAKEVFRKNEPRDLFYRLAVELVDLAIKGKTKFTIAEALSLLLQTWNMAYYRFHHFDIKHYKKIEQLIENYRSEIMLFHKRTILSLDETDKNAITKIFKVFELVLRPVGAAKSLHLLAPNFFPLWDREIAKVYGVTLKPTGKNGENYWNFMKICREQYKEFKENEISDDNPLKAIDEYNYCHFTKHWI